ncbi:MAG: hypothetical protein N3C60_08670 [Calditerrivibrio sp.]|nr:hypothetical protein [Calditerrivibrio sp.]
MSGQNISSAEELHSTKAFFAAESGLELAMTNNLPNGTHTFYIDNIKIEISLTSKDDNYTIPPSTIKTIVSKAESSAMKRKLTAQFRVDR